MCVCVFFFGIVLIGPCSMKFKDWSVMQARVIWDVIGELWKSIYVEIWIKYFNERILTF